MKRFSLFISFFSTAFITLGCVYGLGQEPFTMQELFRSTPISESPEVQRIIQQAQVSAARLEEAIAKNTEVLQQTVQQKTDEFQKQAERESRKIFDQYAQKAATLQREAEKQTTQLRHDAANQILSLIGKAEKEALEARHKARQDALQKTLVTFEHTGQLVSWKDRMRKEFDGSIAYLQDIITQGESAQEAEDFLSRFREQSLWFDNVLATTHQQTGPQYYQLDQKKTALSNIVLTHKDAEKILKARIQLLEQPKEYKKLRLNLLYEINDFMQQKGRAGTAAVASTSLTEKEKENLVERVLQPGAKPQEEPVKKQDDVEKKLQETQVQLDVTQKRITQLEQHLQSSAVASVQQFKQRYVPKFEALSKENIELNTILMDTNQKLVSLKQQLARSTERSSKEFSKLRKEMGNYKKDTKQITRRAELAEELADRKLQENGLQFDVKKTLYNERNHAVRTKEALIKNQSAMLKRQEKLLQKYQAWLDQLGNTLVDKIKSSGVQQPSAATNLTKQQLVANQERENKAHLEREIVSRTLNPQK